MWHCGVKLDANLKELRDKYHAFQLFTTQKIYEVWI